MTKIYDCGERIEYTKGDTFRIFVTATEADEGSTLLFVITKSEDANPVINDTFQLLNDQFEIFLTQQEVNSLSIGDYIYKLILTDASGNITTCISGDLYVKWGA